MKLINARWRLLLALVLPILSLAVLTSYRYYLQIVGEKFEVAIVGFDPRDLLSGHYLTYRVDFGVSGKCDKSDGANNEAYLCVKPVTKIFKYSDNMENCQLFITGQCTNNKEFYVADINRFYIPEEYARELDQLVRSKKGSLILSVKNNGSVTIVDLLIDGKAWREAVREVKPKTNQ